MKVIEKHAVILESGLMTLAGSKRLRKYHRVAWDAILTRAGEIVAEAREAARDLTKKRDGRIYRYNPLWLRWRSLGRPCWERDCPQAGAFMEWLGSVRKQCQIQQPGIFSADRREIWDIYGWQQYVMRQHNRTSV